MSPKTGPKAQRSPYDVTAEECVLGAAMLDAEAHSLAAELPVDVWFKPAHRHIAAALTALADRGAPADPVTVAAELARIGTLDDVGGHRALVEIMASTPSTSNTLHYVGIITDHAAKRRLATYADEVTAIASNGHDARSAVTRARQLLEGIAQQVGIDPDVDTDDTKPAAASRLVEIANELFTFGLSTDGAAFAVPRSGPRLVSLLRGGRPPSLRALLAREYYQRHHRTAPQQALADALLVIEGAAQESPEQPLALRVAHHDGAWWLDLADTAGTAARITAAGWTLTTDVPVLFRRTVLTASLPHPQPGGDLAELWHLLNVEDDDRPLLAAWLVAALRPDIPHPALGISGEQGTGKTTAMKLIVSVIDNSPVLARKPPKDADAWVTAAAGSWVVGLDNLSDIVAWLSDSICRAVTGDGDVRRMLYADADLYVFAFKRCVTFNGIDLGALRGDLADRLVPIHLRPIDDTDRLDEEHLWPAWHDTHHPRVLGGLLELAAQVAATLPTIDLATKPRMADFARILAAVDQVLGTNGYQRYLERQGALAIDTLTADPFVNALTATFTGPFEGTSAQLLEAVTPTDADWRRPKGWPTNARAVSTLLHRQAPVMRKAGWHIDDDAGANKAKVLRWTIDPPTRDSEKTPPPDPPDPPQPPDQDKHPPSVAGQTPGPAGVAGHADPPDPPPPPPDPPPHAHETPGQPATGGSAGQAGQKSAYLSLPAHHGDVWDLEHPCAHCGAPATDISGLCPACLPPRGPGAANTGTP